MICSEDGALHQPIPLPDGTDIVYFDALSREEAAERFPEISAESLVKPDYLGDMDTAGLTCFAASSLDFVIASHVIEHLANPLYAISELFRVLVTGGYAVIAIPDKRFTFDRLR